MDEHHRSRVVENERGRQPEAGYRGEPVAQLHCGERVEAHAPERVSRVDVVGGAVAEHGGDVLAHELEQHREPFCLGQAGDALPPGGIDFPRAPPGGFSHQFTQ